MPPTSPLSDRDLVIETLSRYTYGIDNGNRQLFASTLTEDCFFDFSEYRKCGVDIPDTHGKKDTVDFTMMGAGEAKHTMHYLSNFLVAIEGDCATLTCYVLAQHYRLGEGLRHKNEDYFVMGHKYHVNLVREGNEWKIKVLKLRPSWVHGQPQIVGIQGFDNM